MVSLRALENSQQLERIDRNDVDWERVRSHVYYTLRQRGFDEERAEELAQHAVVEVFTSNPAISQKRASRDAIGAAYGRLHADTTERGLTGADLPSPDQVGEFRHVEQRSAYETQNVAARNGLIAKQQYRDLCDYYAVTPDGISTDLDATVSLLAVRHPDQHGLIVGLVGSGASCFQV